MGYVSVSNASLIPQARNQLTRDFMQTDYSHMLFVDSDIEFDPEHVIAMLRSGKRIVGGTYPQKKIHWDRVEAAVKAGVPTDALQYYATQLTFNPFPESGLKRSSAQRVNAFAGILLDAGMVATVRKTRGDDIAAACGQLAGDVVDRTRVRERDVHSAEIEIEEVESDERSNEHPIEWLKKLN